LLPPALNGGARPAVAGTASELDSVFCTSASSCWADGYLTSGTVTLGEMLHWDGRGWGVVPVPNPAGTRAHDSNELAAVRCLDTNDCWAVGADSAAGQAQYGEALHWNGRKWSSAGTAQPGGSKPADVTQINDSTCTAANDCWAVGDYGHGVGRSEAMRNLALHWNGSRWSRAHVPDPAGSRSGRYNTLYSVRCLSASNCLAVGGVGTAPGGAKSGTRNEVMHWNGTRWSQLATPNPGGTASGAESQLVTLACGSPPSCWSGGFYGTSSPTLSTKDQVLHWNGGTWTRAATPEPGGTAAGDVSYVVGSTCTSPGNCWAVGTYEVTPQAARNQALHWNGAKWSLVAAPDPAGTGKSAVNFLASVACTSASRCWAVGAAEKPSSHLENEILYWDGAKWSVR
jgi:hypothetical protein